MILDQMKIDLKKTHVTKKALISEIAMYVRALHIPPHFRCCTKRFGIVISDLCAKRPQTSTGNRFWNTQRQVSMSSSFFSVGVCIAIVD